LLPGIAVLLVLVVTVTGTVVVVAMGGKMPPSHAHHPILLVRRDVEVEDSVV
jgi:hypothetical protein